MKKPFFITLAVAILLIALGVWGYLFLFGTPKSADDVFADLGFNISPNPSLINETSVATTDFTELANSDSPLTQLTFRPVAGFISYSNESDEEIIRYMEKGTGHIYDINLDTKEETRVTNTTNSKVVRAVFNSTADKVAYITEDGYNTNTYLAFIVESGTEGKLDSRTLPPQAGNLEFISAGILHYTLTSDVTTGYEYNATEGTQKEVFRLPFLSIASQNVNQKYYVYNRFAKTLLGTMYEINGTSFKSLLSQQFGFTGSLNQNWLVYSTTNNQDYKSYALNLVSGQTKNIPIPFIKEKCVFDSDNQNTLWCGAPIEKASESYLENWYMGTLRSNDSIWKIDISNERATLKISPLNALGRELDIENTYIDQTNSFLLFNNKNDDTLWHYDISAS